MEEEAARRKLKSIGMESHEAFQLLYRVRLERVSHSSGRKTNSYQQTVQVLREAGIEPDEVVFRAGSYGSAEWIEGTSKR